jgi:hypothetical protein
MAACPATNHGSILPETKNKQFLMEVLGEFDRKLPHGVCDHQFALRGPFRPCKQATCSVGPLQARFSASLEFQGSTFKGKYISAWVCLNQK